MSSSCACPRVALPRLITSPATDVLTEVLQKIKQVVGSQAGHSPSHGHSSPVAPSGHLDGASALTAHVPTPPTYPSLGRSSRPRTAGSPSYGSPFPQFGAGASTAVTSGPNFTQSGTFSSSPLVSASVLPFGTSSGGRRSSLPVGSATAPAGGTGSDGGRRSSALDALAHLASSASPDVHRFASHMNQPIAALQDAVEQLDEGEAEAEADVVSGEEEGSTGREQAEPGGTTVDSKASAAPGVPGGAASVDAKAGLDVGDDPRHTHRTATTTASARRDSVRSRGDPAGSSHSAERPTKRVRVAKPPAPSPDQLDLVAKGLIADDEARALVDLCVLSSRPES